MRFAYAQHSITPAFPFIQRGFAARCTPWESIYDPIYARMLMLEADETLVLVTLDVLYGNKLFGDTVRKQVAQALDIHPDNILVSYSHTHGALDLRLSGKVEEAVARGFQSQPFTDDTAGIPGLYNDTDQYREYCHGLPPMLAQMAKECKDALRPGRLALCMTESDFGISRRYPAPQGGVLWKPYDNPQAADHTLSLWKLEEEDGTPAALAYSYACHPTTCGPDNLQITADFPGAVSRHIHKALGIPTLFFQGCGADIKPKTTAHDGAFIQLTAQEMEDATIPFAKEIQSLVEKGEWNYIQPQIRVAAEEFYLPCEQWSKEKWQAIADDPQEPEYRRRSAYRSLLLYDLGYLHQGFPYRIHCIALSDDLRILAMEGEVVSEYGKKIRSRLPGTTITLGYTNSACCYIPSAEVLRTGGYEKETFLMAGTTGPFTPQAESTIIHGAEKLYQRTR